MASTLATSRGELVKQLLSLLGLNPDLTTSFKVWVDGPDDFLHIEHSGYVREYTLSVQQIMDKGWMSK